MPFIRHIPNNGLSLLPPDTDLNNEEILNKLVIASRRLGTLHGLCSNLTDPWLLINTLALQESKDSSQIDNILTTQEELYEVISGNGQASAAALDVLNCIEAQYVGWQTMAKRKNVLSVNTLMDIAQVIKGTGTVIRNTPGTIVKDPHTEITYTPPEGAPVIREKLDNLERFINDNNFSSLDPLLKMAIIHYQFMAIYPFSDGNGRTSRILNGLYLVQQGLLPQPVLYLSPYIIKNKFLYYQSLREVTENNNWHDWIIYQLTAGHPSG